MREHFPGYYRLSPDEFEELWNSALIVPDTNVLLTLYRLSDATRQKLLDILEKMQDRLFVPYQVAYEFQQNRLDVIEEQEATYDEVDKKLAGFANEVVKGVRQHPRLDKDDLKQRIQEAIEPVRDHLREARAGHTDPLVDSDTLGSDVVRDALDPLLGARIGEPRDLHELAADGKKRYERKQPPGWKDSEKPEPQRYGDLAIWLDVVERARDEEKPVILITEERKEDWWWVRSGKLVGPHPELAREMRESAGQDLHMCNVERFMAEASKALNLEFSDDDRSDVARARKAAIAEQSRLAELLSTWKGRISPPPTQVASGMVNFDKPDAFWWQTLEDSGLRVGVPREIALPQDSVYTTLTPRWHSSVEVDEDRVTLSVNFGPKAFFTVPEGHFRCTVIGPEGSVASTEFPASAYVGRAVYSDDFDGEIEREAGSYRYIWRYTETTPPTFDPEGNEVASGGFELDSQLPA